MQLLLEMNKCLEEVKMQVFYPLNSMVVDHILFVFLWNGLSMLSGTFDSLDSFTLLQGRLVDILFLSQGELEYIVQEFLKKLVEVSLLL